MSKPYPRTSEPQLFCAHVREVHFGDKRSILQRIKEARKHSRLPYSSSSNSSGMSKFV